MQPGLRKLIRTQTPQSKLIMTQFDTYVFVSSKIDTPVSLRKSNIIAYDSEFALPSLAGLWSLGGGRF